jgi:hypothetical protein
MQLKQWGFTLSDIANELMDMDQKSPAWLKPDSDLPRKTQQVDRVLEAVLIQSRYVCTMEQHIALLANVNKRYVASQSRMHEMQSRPRTIQGMFLLCLDIEP